MPEKANALLMNNKSALIIKCQANQFSVQLYHILGQIGYTVWTGFVFRFISVSGQFQARRRKKTVWLFEVFNNVRSLSASLSEASVLLLLLVVE